MVGLTGFPKEKYDRWIVDLSIKNLTIKLLKYDEGE
jgi:hypothetical protein